MTATNANTCDFHVRGTVGEVTALFGVGEGDFELMPSVRDATAESNYTWLIKRCLTGLLRIEQDEPAVQESTRVHGEDWPARAESMAGLLRLADLERCIRDVVNNGIAGDFLEAGVWRGGASILAKAVLTDLGQFDRTVWLADSFAGLPVPDRKRFPQDSLDLSVYPELSVSLDDVKANFVRYNLLDANVRFIEGWYQDTLANAPVDSLAILRLDCDYYESTYYALTSLYDKVQIGGYVVIDDYALPACRAAVDDFRKSRDIRSHLYSIDWTGVRWQVETR